MQKNWGVTDFVSKIRYLEGYPNFKKSVFLTRYGSNVCMSTNIANESLEQKFLCQILWVGLLSKLKQLVTSPWVNLIFKRQNLQTLTAASWRDSMSRGSKNRKIFNFLHWFFVHFFAICRELVTKIIYPKKVGLPSIQAS